MKNLTIALLILLLVVGGVGIVSASTVDAATVRDLLARQQNGAALTFEEKQVLERAFSPGSEEVSTYLRGGPDTFGYLWRDSDEADGPAFDWVTDDSGTWTEVTAIYSDDATAGPFPIGFDFPFYGTDYTQFWVCSNGWISFVSPGFAEYSNDPIPSTDTPNAILCPFWDDLYLGTGAPHVYYGTDADSNMVITYIDVQRLGGPTGAVLSFQVILHPDGTILLQYDNISANYIVNQATIGIENASGTEGLQILYNGDVLNYPYDSLAIDIYLPPVGADVSGIVTDSENGLPVEGAEVRIGSEITTTDASGFYSFTDMFIASMNLQVFATGYFDFQTVVDLQEGQNTVDIALEPLPLPAFTDDFEEDRGSWILVGDWQIGAPTAGPGAAHGGTGVLGTQLGTDYSSSAQDGLELDSSFSIIHESAFLQYYHWFDYENVWDGYRIDVSTDDGATWQVVTPEGGYTSGSLISTGLPGFTGLSGGWQRVIVPLGMYLDQEIRLRFYHSSDSIINHFGVVIDDMGLYGAQPPGQILGMVTDVGTGDPIDNARIQVFLHGDQSVQTEVQSNGLGEYGV
ncbi:MAG TPA: hypothetical protein ENI92_09750, partial [Bacteroidetes bacterium]|nr:hypothetical protein [Bacteroidota bacterium]